MNTETSLHDAGQSGHTPQSRAAKEGHRPPPHTERAPCRGPIRMLRLAQVRTITGLGKTKIYELQAEGSFPMRVKLTAHSVAWVEEEVQAWLAARITLSAPLVET